VLNAQKTVSPVLIALIAKLAQHFPLDWLMELAQIVQLAVQHVLPQLIASIVCPDTTSLHHLVFYAQ